ncbi:uncharacterized protein LOC135139034 [Zophobas morio]|uniref:uncharacterized protein LOC135139034 n=1 Tax=Zophobas morio TaxID=2755281 RepID=UPI0030832074
MEPNFERGFSLQEALEMAYNDDIDKIFIEPPDNGGITDENSGDEDSGDEDSGDEDSGYEDSGDEDGGGLIDNLPGSQLRAPAEVRLVNSSTPEDNLLYSTAHASTSSGKSKLTEKIE